MSPKLKGIIEYAPLIAFFIAYKFYGMIVATAVILILSVIGVAITYYFEKKVSAANLFTVGILLFFGLLTIFTGNPNFIKVKPTIIYLVFAMVLLFGIANNKLFLKNLLGEKLELSDEDWKILTKRWVYFFFFLASINEFIWRNFSEDFWVKFKVFGFVAFFIVFVYTQREFFVKGQKKD
jgi:intracellular septation protein